jgi:pyridoxal phosphate enzyme (YggS family)
LLFVLFSSCVPAPLCDWAGMRTARLTLRLGFRALAARARPPILTMASSAASDRANAIADNLRVVLDAAARASPSGKPPRVVAVSKTKPVEDLQAAYDAGQRWFAENYVQEICLKSPMMPADVGWRFIGHLQSNKVKLLLESVPSLQCIETVDTEKLANKLNTTVEALGRPPLECFVQVNTSGEESKYGVEPSEVVTLCEHIARNCSNLRLGGLMTIGQPDYTSRPENFSTLSSCRDAVAEALGMDPSSLELSMGMSNDYPAAVEMGSTNVRVGSTIFGARS